MRAIFGILGLLAVVAIVGALVKNQLSASVAPGGGAPQAAAPQQQVRQFEQAVQGVVQQARPMPADDK